jgi:type IV secretory pathway VirB10-like protein
MIDRLRFLLDRPLDPSVARAVVVFASAILLGFACLYVLGAQEPGRSAAPERQIVSPPPGGSFGSDRARPVPPEPHASRPHRQDPQDEAGSPAATRAAKTLNSHRALQHVPYRRGHLTVRLVGARGDRAVLAVSASTISAARRGWRGFLRRYRDSGRSYIPRFSHTGARGADG